MADQSHLDILLQGVEAWNEWREQNAAIMPDLSGAELWNANLSKADLSNANLTGALLSGTNLDGADLSEADLSGAVLAGGDLTKANLSRANLQQATNLTQNQIEQARGNEQTGLPDHLTRPASWSHSSNEQPNRDE